MSKPYYEEYANHAFRFYVRNRNITPAELRGSSNVLNWTACRDALDTLPDEDRIIATMVYMCKSGMVDCVTCVCSEYGLSANRVWRILNRVTKEFATKRGLIHNGCD